jgi:hypothetical protein
VVRFVARRNIGRRFLLSNNFEPRNRAVTVSALTIKDDTDACACFETFWVEMRHSLVSRGDACVAMNARRTLYEYQQNTKRLLSFTLFSSST